MEITIGSKYGKWEVMKFIGKDKWGRPRYLCKCECGTVSDKDGYDLVNGRATNCRKCQNHFHIHGLTNSRLFSIWGNMKQRCLNPKNPRYSIYGGRGISICDEWKNNFQAFYDWAIKNGYKENLTIDRIDNNGNYCPENCHWANITTQLQNRSITRIIEYNNKQYFIDEFCKVFGLNEQKVRQRINRYGYTDAEDLLNPNHLGRHKSNILVTLNGKTKSLPEWGKIFGFNRHTLYNRVYRYGYTPEQALFTPLKNNKKTNTSLTKPEQNQGA